MFQPGTSQSMAPFQSKRRYTGKHRISATTSSCWRNPITVFFIAFSVLVCLSGLASPRSIKKASTLQTQSRKWQRQTNRAEKPLFKNLGDIHYQQVESTSKTTQRYIAVDASGATITVEAWARVIAENATKASSMIEVIRECSFAAVFFETPPVKASTLLSRPFEFVLMDAPDLYQKAHGEMDIRSFGAFFTNEDAAVVFHNLGGDAVLVSPNPVVAANNNDGPSSPNAFFSHLASFARHAPHLIVTETWRTMAQAYLDRVAQVKDQPVWLSTDGRGVSWLHFRLDERPKYYKYAAYKKA